jgi:hypothetical protein
MRCGQTGRGHGLGLGLTISSAIAPDYGGTLIARNVAPQPAVALAGCRADLFERQPAWYDSTMRRAEVFRHAVAERTSREKATNMLAVSARAEKR